MRRIEEQGRRSSRLRMAQGGALVALLILMGTGLWLLVEAGAGRILLLQDYNTRLVVLSTSLLGMGSGLVGTYLLLRKQSLMGDALSHATLPGIALAFLVLVALGGTGKELGWLLAGAAASGLVGVALVGAISRLPRIREDTAMGIILSVFYGAGVALLGLIQDMPGASAAGLESFIYGKTASLVWADFRLLALIAGGVLLTCLLFYKELRLLCFDATYAATQGWPVRFLDLLLLSLTCAVTVAGLQAVGLILIIALLIIPAASARLWTSRMDRMLPLAALIGGLSGWLGSTVSALFFRLPAGAVIVLVAAALFAGSLFFGSERGIVVRRWRHRQLRRREERQHLLRAVFELLEEEGRAAVAEARVPWPALLARRSWSERLLKRTARRAQAAGLVGGLDEVGLSLTQEGIHEAERVTRAHRLWELYLIEHADIAPSHVDRDADSVEHILGSRLASQLEQSLSPALRLAGRPVPASPHALKEGPP